MGDTNQVDRIKQRDNEIFKGAKKRLFALDKKYLFITLLMFLLPSFLMSLIFLLTTISMFISLVAIYFILPMFYACDLRIRYLLTKEGKSNITYADGYRAFFKGNENGVYGALSSFFYALTLTLLLYLILSLLFEPLCNCFEVSKVALSNLNGLLNGQVDFNDIYEFIVNNFAAFTQPLSIIVSLILFLPLLFVFTFLIPNNLSNHLVATLIMPDIDLNMMASQSRRVAQMSMARSLSNAKYKLYFKFNWIYLLFFAALYGISTFLVSLIKTNNLYASLFIIIMTPSILSFFACYFSLFITLNNYAYLIEMKPDIKANLPTEIKVAFDQAYSNPRYKKSHKQDSSPIYDNRSENGDFVDADDFINNPTSEENDVSNKQDSDEKTNTDTSKDDKSDEDDSSIFIDLSGK